MPTRANIPSGKTGPDKLVMQALPDKRRGFFSVQIAGGAPGGERSAVPFMMERIKAEILDEAAVNRALTRMAHEITERNHGTEGLVLVGVLRRGKALAQRLAAAIERFEGVQVPCGELDIHHYRDDLEAAAPILRKAELPFSVVDCKVVLVDDVLYTGRTARAAIEAVFALGRPRAIQLAILIDRGHRELPIRADYVGKSIPTSHQEKVSVRIPPYDGETCVVLLEAADDKETFA